MRTTILASFVFLVTLAGAAQADIIAGTGMAAVDPYDGSIYVNLKGVAQYGVFVGDYDYKYVYGTNILTLDAGRSAPRALGGFQENWVDNVREDFGAVSFGSQIATATALRDSDGEFVGWTASSWMDTYVNVDLATYYSSGLLLWFEYQMLSQEPVRSPCPFQLGSYVGMAGEPYTVNNGGSVSLAARTLGLEGAPGPTEYSWDLNGDGETDVTGANPTLSFDYLTDDLGMALGNHTITCTFDPYDMYASSDSVSLTIVPEPATLCLLAFGGAAMLRRRNVRR